MTKGISTKIQINILGIKYQEDTRWYKVTSFHKKFYKQIWYALKKQTPQQENFSYKKI